MPFPATALCFPSPTGALGDCCCIGGGWLEYAFIAKKSGLKTFPGECQCATDQNEGLLQN